MCGRKVHPHMNTELCQCYFQFFQTSRIPSTFKFELQSVEKVACESFIVKALLGLLDVSRRPIRAAGVSCGK